MKSHRCLCGGQCLSHRICFISSKTNFWRSWSSLPSSVAFKKISRSIAGLKNVAHNAAHSFNQTLTIISNFEISWKSWLSERRRFFNLCRVISLKALSTNINLIELFFAVVSRMSNASIKWRTSWCVTERKSGLNLRRRDLFMNIILPIEWTLWGLGQSVLIQKIFPLPLSGVFRNLIGFSRSLLKFCPPRGRPGGVPRCIAIALVY